MPQYDLSSQRPIQITGHCLSTKKVTFNALVIDISDEGKILKAERVEKSVRALFDKTVSYREDNPVFTIQLTPNSPIYKVVFDSNRILEQTSLREARAIIRDHNFKHMIIWDGDDSWL